MRFDLHGEDGEVYLIDRATGNIIYHLNLAAVSMTDGAFGAMATLTCTGVSMAGNVGEIEADETRIN